MLVRFGAKNFCSIKDWAWVDLTVPAKATDSRDRFAKSELGVRLVKVLGFFGPNASGKTNLMKVPSFISYFIANSFSLEPNEAVPITPFGFNKAEDSASSFQLVIHDDLHGVPFEAVYELEVKLHEVIYESLKFSEKDMGYFIRDKQKLKTSGLFKLSARDPVREKIRKNASVISTFAQFDHKLSMSLRSYFSALSRNVSMYGKEDLPNEFTAAKFFDDDKALQSSLKKYLRWSDPDIVDIKFKTVKTQSSDSPSKETEVTYPIFKHRTLDLDLPYIFASHGTKRFFKVLPFLITALKNGSFAVLDELDMDLHPHLFNKLIEVFTNKNTNPNDAQLVFAAQNPYALTSMEKEEIYLVEKGGDSATQCFRLGEIEKVRRNENFFAKYLSGVYGAVPDL